MKYILTLIPAVALLAACTQEAQQARPSGAPQPEAIEATASAGASTEAEAAAEVAPASAPATGVLGRTIASLGDPGRSGLWIETPLVSAPGKGRVVYLANGKSTNVDLIPIAGEKTAGSRLSLSAMLAMSMALTDLPEVEVFAN